MRVGADSTLGAISSRCLLVVLALLVVACCPSRESARARSPSPLPRRHARETEFRASLILRVVNDPTARGTEPLKALEVTLKNSVESQGFVWVNSRVASLGISGHGEVQIELRDENGPIENECTPHVTSPEAWEYVLLERGASITRVLTLGCFKMMGSRRVWATVRFEDTEQNPPPAPLPEVTRLFRGPVVSNTVTFIGAVVIQVQCAATLLHP
jgi:hypothetical protein